MCSEKIKNVAFFVVFATACFYQSLLCAQGLSPEQATLAKNGTRVLNTYCKKCHGDGLVYPGLDMTDREGLLNPSNGQPPYVVAGDLDSSRIWKRMASHTMPPANQPQPSAEDMEFVKQWILQGAYFPDAVDRSKREFLGDKSIVKFIADDLDDIDSEAIPYTRYFSLAHLWNNNSGKNLTTDEDLRYVRAAVSKLANSLSYQPRIAVPRIVDEDYGTLLAIDIRDYGWSQEMWDEMLTYYPYGLKVGGKHAQRVYRDTDCYTPVVRADWFVNTASRPPLYHKMLSIPDNAKVLENKLGVDIAQNFSSNQMMRAAFSGRQSGVSEQNRMVERHDQAGASRFYWKSYDMLPGPDREHDFQRTPLGPSGMNDRYRGAAFAHDGGEIIFSLPNGLQAYMLVDGKDNRIDVGPQEVVNDPNQHSGTFNIVNGVSCMGCHKQGMIQWQADFVRPSFQSREGEPVADKVLEIFPADDEFAKIVAEDGKVFMNSLDQACGDFLLGANRADLASKYHQFFEDVLLAKKADYDPSELKQFLVEETKRDVYASLGPKEAIIQLASKGKEQKNWDISIDGVLAMYELNPMTKRKTVGDFEDPVTHVVARYKRDISLNDACLELGLPLVPEDAERLNMKSYYDLKAICDTRQFREMGIGPLGLKGGTIARESWEKFYGPVATQMGQGVQIEWSQH